MLDWSCCIFSKQINTCGFIVLLDLSRCTIMCYKTNSWGCICCLDWYCCTSSLKHIVRICFGLVWLYFFEKKAYCGCIYDWTGIDVHLVYKKTIACLFVVWTGLVVHFLCKKNYWLLCCCWTSLVVHLFLCSFITNSWCFIYWLDWSCYTFLCFKQCIENLCVCWTGIVVHYENTI